MLSGRRKVERKLKARQMGEDVRGRRRDGVRRSKMGFYVCVQNDFNANIFSCLRCTY